MGAKEGGMWQRITYHLPPPTGPGSADLGNPQHGTVNIEDAQGKVTSRQLSSSFWDFLEQQMAGRHCQAGSCSQLPFDFAGGFVGYLGYELKAETCGDNMFSSPYPDASLFLVDR